ncbi:MAG: ATP-binding protein, partial [Gemmatimonadaceae bacterium]
LRLALEVAELGTWSWNLETGTGDIDARGAEIVGLPAGALTNVGDAQLSTIHRDDLLAVQAVIAEQIVGAHAFGLAYRVVRSDGSIRHVASRARVVADAAGRPVRLVGTNRDVTTEREAEAHLRESEARYRTLVEGIDQGFCVLELLFDPEGRPVDFLFLETNRAFVEQTGLVNAVGRRARAVLPLLEQDWFERYGRVALSGEPARFEACAAELGRWFDVYAVRVGEARERRVAVLFNDISARRRNEAERERLLADAQTARGQAESARAEAEAANRAKSEFLAVMSHELRTPLNAIGGYAELMEMGIRGPVTEQQREDLHRLQSSQRHLLGLINEVLNYARLETGTVRYDLAVVHLRAALLGAEALVAPQARAKGLVLDVADFPAELAVVADAEKLRQIVVNLLSNAIKFTERGGRVELRCDDTSRDGVALASANEFSAEELERPIRIEVRDTGIGIPADQLDRIFEPFVQVRADLTRTAEGTGLGLAISRDLARGMNGELTVESEVGVGTTFFLTLPRA